MRTIITIEDLRKTACATRNPHLFDKQPKRKPTERGKKEKAWLLFNLGLWCLDNNLKLETEYRFHDLRKFRFDYAITTPGWKLAIEYNGIFSDKSRHTTATGYTIDRDKINLAISEGWQVLELTAINYRDVIGLLDECLKNKNGR